LFQVVIPRFADLYAGMGLKMAGGTRFLIAFAPMAPRLLGIGLGIGVAGWLCWRYLGRPIERIRAFCLRLPLIRKWTWIERTHEWASTLGLLLDGGLPLVQALDVQSQLPLRLGNRDICQRVRERVVQGVSLGDALQLEELDERLMISVQVAEVTGDLSRALLAVERELAAARKAMMTSLFKAFEPILILLAGALVGVVALFMLWPMLDLLNTI
jgi:type II secretory pathway component PulF